MTRGRKAKVGGLRPDQRKPSKQLDPKKNEHNEIPELPPADQFLGVGRTWPEPVKAWWRDIFRSPMSSEWVSSDVHGLYNAARFLAEAINPNNKISERLKCSQAWEKSLVSFGLTPTAREGLRWQISQGEMAERRTRELRSAPTSTVTTERVPGSSDQILTLYSQIHG
ncbi:hypothetical protein CKALI_06455 [Corynebacterium kalinowskii]|uniref:Terminase small subunit n=1 Tax=Corynebacterium kalinowskii TaxID=2675216 RepID=A0A6B8VXX6_9CORY|nr:hypothetical protein [Corynebacterium kalinowskii]QGU02160.1 hypothetical protein CKALI_06455 [Corynebacterium kalinowskii]